MIRNLSKLVLYIGAVLLAPPVFSSEQEDISAQALEPTLCVKSTFTSFEAVDKNQWKSIILKLTNECNRNIDFQNAVITFQNKIALNTNFWGNFDPLAYPDNNMQITSQASGSNFIATLGLHFPNYPGATSVLPANKSIQIMYGATSEGHIGSANVYLEGNNTPTGSIQLKNTSAKPTDVTQLYSVVHILTNGAPFTDVQLAWNSSQTIAGIMPGNYTIRADSINGTSGNNYLGTASPSSISVISGQTNTSNITYTLVQQTGKLAIQLQSLPAELAGYTGRPTAQVMDAANSVQSLLSWGNTATVSQLKNNNTYSFSTPAISFNNYKCNPIFSPSSLIASSTTLPLTKLSYSCSLNSSNTPVAMNGQLSVCKTQLCNERQEAIQLKGMSSHGIQWFGWQGSNTTRACLTTASLDALTSSWGASVIRVSMYIQEGGYETDPAGFTNQVNALIEEATKRGVYVIVDWHILTPGDPNINLSKAKTFFSAIANAHKNKNNLIYEIANEPNGVTWSKIKTYAEALIPVIRAIDNKSIILVGTPGWSSLGISDGRSSQDIINSPVNAQNIMYTFHFYAASHRDNYLNEVARASDVLPIFVTEFGTQSYTGDGANDFAMTDRYLELFARKKISWTNWNYSDDTGSGAVWIGGTCSNGPWSDNRLKAAGVYLKAKIQN